MRNNEWGSGTPIEVERLGRCTAYRRIINGEFYQWKIKFGFTEVIGEYAIGNADALQNAMLELKRRFNSILHD
jgi:hypothetical protein